jgi:hypothetical protein
VCQDGWGTLEEIATHGWASSFPNWTYFTGQAHTWFGLSDDSWDPAGADDWNDGQRPYGKTLTSLFLIVYGLGNTFVAWHPTEDYVNCTLVPKNSFHDDFYMRYIEYSGSAEADAEPEALSRNRTNLHCPLFDVGNRSSNFPSHRAGVIVHEAWHQWQDAHGFTGNHPGGCSGVECDYFYPHGYSWSHHDTLDYYSLGPPILFHSPIQIEAEFLTDLALFPRGGLPTVVAQTARNHANTLLGKYFVNRVGYRVGDPRPFW